MDKSELGEAITSIQEDGVAIHKSLKEKREQLYDRMEVLDIAQQVLADKQELLKIRRAYILANTNWKEQNPPITNKEGREAHADEQSTIERGEYYEQQETVRKIQRDVQRISDEYHDLRLIIKSQMAMYTFMSGQ